MKKTKKKVSLNSRSKLTLYFHYGLDGEIDAVYLADGKKAYKMDTSLVGLSIYFAMMKETATPSV